MQATLRAPSSRENQSRNLTLPLMLIGGVLLFLAAPWSLDHKAHLALHGLCAQTPSHTLRFDGRKLPFDSRMTGIYGGFISSAALLVRRRAYRAACLPDWRVLSVLAL